MTPERFDELLLDYLYDLLDEADARAVREHVAAHPEAQAKVERARGLLAGAARYEFPGVRFAGPGAEPVASPAGAAPAGARRTWLVWAVAAAVLIAVGVAAYPVCKHVSEYLDARHGHEVAQNDLDGARHEREQLVRERDRE